MMGRIEWRIKGLKVSMVRRRKKREEEIHVIITMPSVQKELNNVCLNTRLVVVLVHSARILMSICHVPSTVLGGRLISVNKIEAVFFLMEHIHLVHCSFSYIW